jgi:hypothetical protein
VKIIEKRYVFIVNLWIFEFGSHIQYSETNIFPGKPCELYTYLHVLDYIVTI